MGDESLLWGISRWLMCQQREGLKSCGHCHACQLMQAHTHPDWHLLGVEKGKSSLGVDAVRAVTETLFHHAQQGGAKIVTVPDASLLTEAAANALLKTLEEPPKNCWFLLFSQQPSRLPATLRSRCFRYHLAVPDEEQGLAWLQKQISVTESEALSALRLSGGAPAAAQSLLEASVWRSRHALCQVLPLALRGDILTLIGELNDDNVQRRTGWLYSLLVDALKWQQGGGEFIANVDQQALIADIAVLLPANALNESLRLWINCREQLGIASVNRELILTDQLLTWEQALRGLQTGSPN